MEKSPERAGVPRLTRWADMKAEFEKRFIPSTYLQDLSERIGGFTQGYLSVADVSGEFHTLISRVEVDEPEYIIVGRYKRGFRKSKPVDFTSLLTI